MQKKYFNADMMCRRLLAHAKIHLDVSRSLALPKSGILNARYEALADSLAKVDAQDSRAVNRALCLRSATQEDVGDADPDALARLEDHWLRFMV